MDSYKVTLAFLGFVLVGASWLPHLLRGRLLTFPIAYVGLGALFYSLPLGLTLPDPDPFLFSEATERITELVVLISLSSVGLRIDTVIGWKRWNTTWRLLGIAMPICMVAGALLGHWLLSTSLAATCLIAALLAPTDPVLASDIQVAAPGKGKEDNVRLALTSEAGLNDGLAFPFVWLAIALDAAAPGDYSWLASWLAYDVLYRCAAGVAVGYAMGYALMHLIFRFHISKEISKNSDGLVVLAITLLVYGVCEAVHGYGFLAVFVSALAIRHYEREHEFHDTLNQFAEQCERLLVTAVLLLFGGALASGILESLTWASAAFGLLFVLVVRPISGLIALLGSDLPWRERFAISGFGVRGIGSIYYLAFALNYAVFPSPKKLWATVAFVVLISIILHGMAGTRVMQYLDRQRWLSRRRKAKAKANENSLPAP